MATSGRGSGVVGYNVQTAVDAEHHLIVAHEVSNVGNDRGQLSNMAGQAKAAMGVETLDALADRGYFKGEEILARELIGVTPLRSQAAHLGRQGRRPVRQAGLRLQRRRRHLAMPGRRTSDAALHLGGRRDDLAHLLDDQVR
jgi:hypothetical protein